MVPHRAGRFRSNPARRLDYARAYRASRIVQANADPLALAGGAILFYRWGEGPGHGPVD